MASMADIKTTGVVRRELGLTVAQLSYLLASRPELEPGRVGAQRAWTASDIAKARASLKARPMERTRPVVGR